MAWEICLIWAISLTGMPKSPCLYALSYALADFLVDVTPIIKRTLQDRLGHAFFQVPHNVGHEPVTLRIGVGE
ncbi:MAG: hypothetical protein Kow0063_03210 [Anaerolineae bacterium]